ncbi:hypothetical protein HKCCE3408_18845 [Rhodobacterales bacterium HKCCE3408]|nr:hypothetical protein [Rhodobacterales bacterium HKCCE3408]
MSGIGHNRGPSMEPGQAFRKLAWTKARSDLLPTLPLEVVRLRVARAKRLGLPYQTYATIRATSGHDIVAFLFSGNALELTPRRVEVPERVAARLSELPADRLAAIYAPAHPDAVIGANPGLIDLAAPAPAFTESWRATRDRLREIVRARGLSRDGVVLVAATAVERDWCGTAGLAGALPAEAFFAGS